MKKIVQLLLAAAMGFVCCHNGWAAETIKLNESAVQGACMSRDEQIAPFNKALEVYDMAFQSRDINALKQIFADDIVMFEQGTQNIGKEDVLNKHLGPELLSFQELSATYYDQRITEAGTAAIVTRQLSVKGKRQGRLSNYIGRETQGWKYRDGRWQLFHIHYSFPAR